MLCLECGAEMRLAQVVEDTTMFVPGYEHHTWRCSACSTVEQRFPYICDAVTTGTREHAQTVAQQQPAASPKVRRIAIAESAKLVQRGVAHAQLLRSTAQRTLQFLVTANARQLPHASRSAPVDGFRQAAPTALGLKVR